MRGPDRVGSDPKEVSTVEAAASERSASSPGDALGWETDSSADAKAGVCCPFDEQHGQLEVSGA